MGREKKKKRQYLALVYFLWWIITVWFDMVSTVTTPPTPTPDKPLLPPPPCLSKKPPVRHYVSIQLCAQQDISGVGGSFPGWNMLKLMLNLKKVFSYKAKASQVHCLQLQNALTNYEWLRLIRESRRKPAEWITANASILNHQGWQFSRQEQLMDHMLHLDSFLLVTAAVRWRSLKQTQN